MPIRSNVSRNISSLELFAGAGGLALGTGRAGFRPKAVVEWDDDACKTLSANRHEEWLLYHGDVKLFDFKPFAGVDLVSGGPPCQPFSIGGKHRGPRDRRNLFGEMVRAVRETAPKAIMVENVRGLLRPNFVKFFEYIVLQLTHPEISRDTDEDWTGHLSRLERHHTKGSIKGLNYNVVFQCLNAADYGVPQKRHRVFIIGFRSDLRIEWSFPAPTHSREALIHSQMETGEYWEQHRIARKLRQDISEKLRFRLPIEKSLFPPAESRWRTVRDAICDLPEPGPVAHSQIANHIANPGARIYPGHTGSPFDEPAKAIKAGDHGVPGGENMLALPDGGVRYFSVRETARLQTFPDDYRITGSWTEAMRQLGNAVPVDLAAVVASSIGLKLR